MNKNGCKKSDALRETKKERKRRLKQAQDLERQKQNDFDELMEDLDQYN